MCLAVPMRLISVAGRTGLVEHAGVRLEVGLDCLERPVVGEYLVIHAGFAIARVDAEEAKATLDLFRQLAEAADDGNA